MNAYPSIAAIKLSVAAQFGVTARDMVSQYRAVHVARPRQVGMYLARELTPVSYPQIGMAFGGRDHTTVMHAHSRIGELVAVNPDLRRRVEALRLSLSDATTLVEVPANCSLDEAARAAMNRAVRRAKLDPDMTITGTEDAVRRTLFEAFGEEPRFRAQGANEQVIEFLVSPEGSWSRLVIDGAVAKVAESGIEWVSV